MITHLLSDYDKKYDNLFCTTLKSNTVKIYAEKLEHHSWIHLINCDSNIGLFSIVPPLVIALPTLR